MATFYIWKCNTCDFGFTAQGPQECNIEHKDQEKIITPLPHPITPLAQGLYAHGYCKNCQEEKDTIIVEYKTPSDPFITPKDNIKEEYLNNYRGYIEDHPEKEVILTECYNFDSLRCPTCNEILVFYPYKTKPFPCPECNKGTVEKTGHMMS